jgi:thiol peroxidase
MPQVTFKGNPLTLEGTLVKVGDKAPAFVLADNDLGVKKLSDYAGKVKVITTFPSIDTPVCDMQVREFNKRAASLSKDVAVLGVSVDLPFAQARFCAAAGITGVTTLSDYKERAFSRSYGLFIKELALTARSVIIVDKNDTVVYFELVKEVTEQPNYNAALESLAKVL